MENEIRQFYTNLIDMANTYPTIPWETKRLAFENVLNKIEKLADNAIREEVGSEIHIDNLVIGDNEVSENAKMLSENKLGELPQ